MQGHAHLGGPLARPIQRALDHPARPQRREDRGQVLAGDHLESKLPGGPRIVIVHHDPDAEHRGQHAHHPAHARGAVLRDGADRRPGGAHLQVALLRPDDLEDGGVGQDDVVLAIDEPVVADGVDAKQIAGHEPQITGLERIADQPARVDVRDIGARASHGHTDVRAMPAGFMVRVTIDITRYLPVGGPALVPGPDGLIQVLGDPLPGPVFNRPGIRRSSQDDAADRPAAERERSHRDHAGSLPSGPP